MGIEVVSRYGVSSQMTSVLCNPSIVTMQLL